PRDFKPLAASSLATLLARPDLTTNLDPANPDSHLAHILIPRPADTANNTLVRNYIADTLRGLGWAVEEDSFIDSTPYGDKHFTNVIATKDPTAPRRVVLAAHFDSKFFPSYPANQFVGATDSAAPCALMLDLAAALDPLLNARAKRLVEDALLPDEDEDVAETTLQLVFFDGEEAFKDWTDTDSIYGARHLAAKWAAEPLPPHLRRRRLSPSTAPTALALVDHLILLDLLGARDPRIRSYFPDTAWLFDALAGAEAALHAARAIGDETSGDGFRSFFLKRTGREISDARMGDDHVPFLRAGVAVLHVIAEPFPSVWHRLSDDASALHLPTLRRWNAVLRVFFAQYLGLRPEDVD
ncbi:hypothetical protein K488DRAFT_21111, partial [Vararia minispora EC-137]